MRGRGGHPDLKDNVDATRTKHWGGRTGEDPTKRGSYHGTAVAGVIAARDNAVGGRGVAPRATLVNYNFLDEQSSANKIAALTLNKETVAAYNMSFGPGDDVRIARKSDGWRRAVEEGLSSGFGGKGSLYVVAAGNGGRFIGADWATLDEQNNHRGVIATCAVNLYGVAADYSEQGPSLWVCAPSNDTSGRYPGILTTVGAEYYADSFGGTSAAAPIVSGVIALMRSANSDLTWRDVKLILANTAQKNDPTNPGWVSAGDKYGSSGEKYSFNNEYGFGTVDASAAVQAASNWSLLPAEQSAAVASSTVAALPTYGNEIVLTADVTTTIDFVEQVTISITADIFDLRAYRWTLVSPSGTESLLAPEYLNCRSIVCSWIGTFHFGSNRHLGEGGSGAWKVKVRRHDADVTVCGNQVSALHSILCSQMQGIDEEIEAFKLVVYGHKAESGRPVRLSAAPLSVAEGGELSLSVAVDGDPLAADLVIPLQFADSNTTPVGLPGADYGALASITIPAGSTSATAKLAITQDTVYEGAETFVVRLGALPAGFKRAGNPVSVTIADDEAVPTVTLKTSSATVAEGDSVTITASLSHAAEESVTLSLSATPIAPAVAADGSILTHATLTIAGGATSSTGVAAFSSVENALYELSTATAKKFKISAAASGGRGVADPAAITVEIEDDETKPVVSITAGADVTEGADATFTLTASPKAEADFVVDVFVTVSGDYGVSAGARTVTIPRSGTATLTLPTTDDQVDEPGGSVTASVLSGPDNTPATPSSASVDIADNDDAPSSADYQTVVDLLIDVRDNPANDLVRGNPAHILKWNRVLAAIGYHSGESAMPESEIHAKAAQWPDSPFKQASDYLNSQNQPPTPVVSITGGSGVSEGGDVTFTLTASPAPAADLDVALTIAAVGDYGVTAGSQTVTIPTSGSQTLTIATTDDQTDETDGSVTATLVDGSAYDLGASKTATVSVSDDDLAAPPQTPVVSIAAGGSVTEGSGARFTLSASPAPTQNLNVSLLIGKSGDYGVASGFRTVTIPASGSVTLTIPTTGDEADEADGFVSATLLDGTEYDVGASSSGQVAILDDDDPPPGYTVDPSVVAAVKTLAAQTQHGTAHVNRWQRVLVAFGEHGGTGVVGGAMTAAEAQQMANTYSSPVWDEVVVELTALEASLSAVPVVSIAAGSDISEGGDLTFTLTASPAPAADLAVTVTIATVGDYGVAAGSRTVTIPASGSQTLTIATTGDQVDEADGSVTATLVDGSAYDLGASKTATVAVSDDDDPPPPVVSISGGAGVSEGGDVSFTLTASPVPAADLDVTVTIATVGDYGVTAGSRTVTIPTSGSQTLTIATAGDQTDEADGSVTATLVDGAAYDLGASKTATVAVSDDDDPPPPVVSISGGAGVSEGGDVSFTLTASPVPAADLDVTVTIATVGDYGVTAGSRTVTIPTSGSQTLTIATAGDQTDEADGSVTATLVDGAAYDLGASKTATVAVSDDDDPPPQTPVVSIAGGAGVSEGGRVTFTLTASPAPAADLDVTVTIAAVGDYGVAAGNRTVTIPASGRVTLTIATTGDQTDEADGSVTATLVDGADYDLGTPKTATVTVSDDDDPPVVVQPVTPVLSACVGEPTLLISSPTASRSDASVDFEVRLDCIPSGRATMLVTARRDGVLTEHHYVSLSGEQTSDTVTLQLEGERRLGLALTFERGLANRSAQGDVQFTD
ncbi:MAG: S8 family serine peptidase [Spirochaetaceae bacterium]|nr:S8 family serine peptidase [Spirochaetaceae bacterium]